MYVCICFAKIPSICEDLQFQLEKPPSYNIASRSLSTLIFAFVSFLFFRKCSILPPSSSVTYATIVTSLKCEIQQERKKKAIMPVHVGPPMGHPQGPPPMPPQGHHMQGYGGPPPSHQYPAPPPPNMQYNKNGGGPPAPMQQPMGGGGYPQQMSDDVEMAQKRKDFETLCQIINAWNANRLDLFALSLPNEVGMTIFFFKF